MTDCCNLVFLVQYIGTRNKYNEINTFNREKGSALARHHAVNNKSYEIIKKMFVILRN